jgi:hypothetical protein
MALAGSPIEFGDFLKEICGYVVPNVSHQGGKGFGNLPVTILKFRQSEIWTM